MRAEKPTTMRLAPTHGWRAQPNHKILVLGRGAVRLEYPQHWVVDADDDCVKVHDKPPPDDDCVLGVSFHLWPREGAALSVASCVRSAMDGDERAFHTLDPIVEETRLDIALAWSQGRFIDPTAQREACSRTCLARKDEIQALVTFDFWLSDVEACDARWHAFLATLQLARWIEDPRRGPSVS